MDGSIDASMPVDLDGVNVDLFGDPVDLGLPTARPPSKRFLQLMDEMRIRGCCQKITWSKQGTIASVSQDGRFIELRYLRVNPRDGSWGLSEPTPFAHFGNSPASQIVHLCWSPAVTVPELAVIDAVGRIAILSFPTNLNRPYFFRPWDPDPVDDLNAVVGSFWLGLPPQSKQSYIALNGPAVRDGNNYKYENSFWPALGPFHPNMSKSAFISITASGVLKLHFTQNNNRMQETRLELESISSSDELITHASFCSDKSSSLYIVMATASKQLKVAKVQINWGHPQGGDKQIPLSAHPLNPSLKGEKRLAVTNWLQNDEGVSHLDPAMTQLSVLELIPTTLASNHQSWVPPVILAARTYIPSMSVSASAYNDHNQHHNEMQSIVDMWEILTDQAQDTHPAFQKLNSRNSMSSNTPQTATRLKKRESIVLNKVLVSIHTLQPGKVICFAFSDGTVQYRDRFTMEEIYTSPDLDRIMTLNQVGFQFVEETPCLQVAFSPTNCSSMQICEDGRIKWNLLRFPAGDIGSSTHDAQYYAVIAGLAVAVSGTAAALWNYDDVLAIARQFSDKPRFAHDWMTEVIRLLKIHVDYSEEVHHEQLVRNSNLQLCLSILNHFGYNGDFKPRSFCGKFAMMTLNVRNIVILITVASNMPTAKEKHQTALDEPEVLDALAGSVKWALDLLAWLCDSLFELADDDKFIGLLTPSDWKNMAAYLQSKNEVALHLLLCSSTRGFLSAVSRRLVHLDTMSQKALAYYETRKQQDSWDPSHTPLYKAFQKIQRYSAGGLVKATEFDRLLAVLGHDIRATYQASLLPLSQKQNQMAAAAASSGGGNKQQQQQQGAADQAVKRAQLHCEVNLLLGNAPPSSFLQILIKFFTKDLKQFKQHVTDPAEIFFGDYSLLEVLDDKKSLAQRKERGTYVDVFRRVEVRLVAGGGNGLDDDDGEDSDVDETLAVGFGAGPAAGVGAGGQGFGFAFGQKMLGIQGLPQPQGALRLRRRCVRCAAVMEEMTPTKPGFHIVMNQQKRCACGGSWGLLPRGATMG